MLMLRPGLRVSKWTKGSISLLHKLSLLPPVENSPRKGVAFECRAVICREPLPRYNTDVHFTIRDFQTADFDTLWRIDQDCFPPGISYSRTELKVYMRRRGSFTLVATHNHSNSSRHIDSAASSSGSAAGFIVAEVQTGNQRSSGHIITIDVTDSARRTGVGSLLLRAAEERLRKAGCCSVELETAVDNLSALSFYKHHGYSVIGTFPRYYSNGVDALVLQKALAG